MLISIIVPVYNTEKFISRCIESILRQSLQDFEVIIVNDSTPDSAMDIVKSYAQNDNRIKILSHDHNRGLMVARRTGYRAASGDYLMFLDSDDTLPQDALEALYNRILKSNSDMVVAGFNIVDENNKIIRQSLPAIDGVYDTGTIIRKLMQRALTHNLAFCMFRKNLFDRNYITYENQTNGEDLILFYQLVETAKRIDIFPRVVYNYFTNSSSSTKSPVTERKIQQLVNVQNFKFGFLTRVGIPEKDVLKFIHPTLMEWFCYDFGRKAIGQLPIPLQNSLKVSHIYGYMSFLSATYISVLRLFPFLSPLLRRILF